MEDIPQFIGYWGYGRRGELEARLSKAIDSHSIRKQIPEIPVEENNHLPIGNIANLSFDQETAFSQECSLSASGLEHCADVWVRLQANDCLVLGREPFGRVQLYWLKQEETIWFASRSQFLLSLLENPQVNIAGLYGYTCFSYVPTPLTPVTDVYTIPAGSELTWKCHQDLGVILPPVSRQIYEWKQSSTQISDEQTAINQLQLLLKNAIASQITDLTSAPVGVFLSGGLDSSIVAALLVQAGVKVRAYTLDFGSVGIPEYPYAEQVAKFLNIPLVKVAVTPNLIKKAIIPTVKALDLPFGDGVTVPLYLLNQAASQETAVIFNGEGGDQLFAGWTNKPAIAASVYGENNFSEIYLRTFHRLWGYEAQIFQPDIYNQVQQLDPENWLQAALDPNFCQALLHRLRRASLMLKGAQNIHPRATNLGFAHGLKVRSPFCDLALAEWTFQLTGELYLQGSCEKYILKRAVENWLPAEIVWRQKRGMGVPLTSWCLNNFWYQIGTWLNPGILRTENCFDPQIAVKIVSGTLGANIQGRRIGETLWLFIMWELWKIHIFGEKSAFKSWNHPFWCPRSVSMKIIKK